MDMHSSEADSLILLDLVSVLRIVLSLFIFHLQHYRCIFSMTHMSLLRPESLNSINQSNKRVKTIREPRTVHGNFHWARKIARWRNWAFREFESSEKLTEAIKKSYSFLDRFLTSFLSTVSGRFFLMLEIFDPDKINFLIYRLINHSFLKSAQAIQLSDETTGKIVSPFMVFRSVLIVLITSCLVIVHDNTWKCF